VLSFFFAHEKSIAKGHPCDMLCDGLSKRKKTMLTNLGKEMVGRLVKFEGTIQAHPKGTMLFTDVHANNNNKLYYYWMEKNVVFVLSMKTAEIQEFLLKNKTMIYGTVPTERGSISYFMTIEEV
jgi:hypothetical protein